MIGQAAKYAALHVGGKLEEFLASRGVLECGAGFLPRYVSLLLVVRAPNATGRGSRNDRGV